MKQNTFVGVAGAVFSLIAILHLLRLLFRWEAAIGGWHVPLWISWAAIAVSGYLAWTAFTLRK